MISLAQALDKFAVRLSAFLPVAASWRPRRAGLVSQARAAEQNSVYVLALNDCRVK